MEALDADAVDITVLEQRKRYNPMPQGSRHPSTSSGTIAQDVAMLNDRDVPVLICSRQP